jgi:CBS domain-containing protein
MFSKEEFVMTVRHILSQKGRDVVTVKPDSTLQEVAVLMSDKGIGAVVMRTIATNGGDALKERVSSHMSTQVISCEEGTTVQVIMEKMTAGRFRHMPVVTDGQLVGMISIGDLVKKRIMDVESEQEELKKYIASA